MSLNTHVLNAKSIEVQLISQIQPKRSFRASSVLRYPNHFFLAGVQHCLGLKRHYYPMIPRAPWLIKSRSFSGILTAYFHCKYFPLYTRELLVCLLGGNKYFGAKYTNFFIPFSYTNRCLNHCSFYLWHSSSFLVYFLVNMITTMKTW